MPYYTYSSEGGPDNSESRRRGLDSLMIEDQDAEMLVRCFVRSHLNLEGSKHAKIPVNL